MRQVLELVTLIVYMQQQYKKELELNNMLDKRFILERRLKILGEFLVYVISNETKPIGFSDELNKLIKLWVTPVPFVDLRNPEDKNVVPVKQKAFKEVNELIMDQKMTNLQGMVQEWCATLEGVSVNQWSLQSIPFEKYGFVVTKKSSSSSSSSVPSAIAPNSCFHPVSSIKTETGSVGADPKVNSTTKSLN